MQIPESILTPTARLWLGLCVPGFHVAISQESVRAAEIAQCLPGEISTWGDGKDRPAHSTSMVFVYDHVGAPAWFEETQVFGAVQKAAQWWSLCGIPSSVLRQAGQASQALGAVRVQWSAKDSAGISALPILAREHCPGPEAFALLRKVNPTYDASQTLQMVISHEMGHHFGLMAHSRRCVDVTSYYDNGKGAKCFARDLTQLNTVVEYRSVLPTACDIERCRIANGMQRPTVSSPDIRLKFHSSIVLH
ncbi:MAG: hypothetical protein IPH54_12135 [Rhodoferax sp.]|nr:hypothetical protein [Rhodoferax sp.]